MKLTPNEKDFENYIVQKLLENGWVKGESSFYDKKRAFCHEDILSWIQSTQEKDYNQLIFSLGKEKGEEALLKNLEETLQREGTLFVVKEGFKIKEVANASFIMSQNFPEDNRNPLITDEYNKNILRVIPQLYYSLENNNSIDLVFFLNGLPLATMEVKTDFNQSVKNAIEQYKKDRKPKNFQNKEEPLLKFKRGAIVHFALSESKVYMTTHLKGEETFFLPFNPVQKKLEELEEEDKEDYTTSYFWNYIALKENWLKIFHNFAFYDKGKDLILFPRFHQFDAVTKIIQEVKEKGSGENYLFEHSAGSGKTATITWLTFALSKMTREGKEGSYFDSIIVITDRKVLDEQIKKSIVSLEDQKGVIQEINGFDSSKSKELKEALITKKKVIIVTIQTFSYVMKDAFEILEKLKDKNFAIIIDEAHSSQSGESAASVNQLLSSDSILEKIDNLQKSRKNSKNISRFAFTATPKDLTKQLFGNKENSYESFHLYPMRQAIEEGFILDVLKGFISYKTIYKVGEKEKTSCLVNEKQAIKEVQKWVFENSTTILSKIDIIVKHFHQNVEFFLNHTGKAMIITSSRVNAVRYKLFLDDYLKGHEKYKKYKSLVAFSDKLSPQEISHFDDSEHQKKLIESLNQENITEDFLNQNSKQKHIPTLFNENEYKFLIVANKFQTGFDQPKLCALYVDKSIGNEIEVVQTYSRLNRSYKGKTQTYILDFINEPSHILESFQKYDSGASLEEEIKEEILYSIKEEIDRLAYEYNFYKEEDIEEFKELFSLEAKENNKIALSHFWERISSFFNDEVKKIETLLENQVNLINRLKESEEKSLSDLEKERDSYSIQLKQLMNFKKLLKKFEKFYLNITSLYRIEDINLEYFFHFCKNLGFRLQDISFSKISTENLVLESLAITEDIDGNLSTLERVNSQEPKDIYKREGSLGRSESPYIYVTYYEIFEKLSLDFSDRVTKDSVISFIEKTIQELKKIPAVMHQVQNNPEENAIKGKLKESLEDIISEKGEAVSDFYSYIEDTQEGKEKFNILIRYVYQILKEAS